MQKVKIYHENTKVGKHEKKAGYARPLAPAPRGSFESQSKKRKAILKIVIRGLDRTNERWLDRLLQIIYENYTII